MSGSTAQNPFAAPRAPKSPVIVAEQAIPWGRWIFAAVIFELLLSLLTVLVPRHFFLGLPGGIVGASITCVALLIVSVFAGIRYATPQALWLTQTINTCVWLTMLATVFMALPIYTSYSISPHDLWGFLGFWLVGTFGAGIFTLLSSGFQKTSTSTDSHSQILD